MGPDISPCYVQILGNGLDTQDTSPSILLFFDKERFLFNAGEGLQRFCTEHPVKLSKINHVLLTRVCSETAGGLPGVLLTLAGIGAKAVKLWGPSGLQKLVDAMRCFVPGRALACTESLSSDGPLKFAKPDPEDQPNKKMKPDPEAQLKEKREENPEVVKISAILLRPGECAPMSNPPPAGGGEDISVIYVCELPEIRGKFDPEKAKALGVEPPKPPPKKGSAQIRQKEMSKFCKLQLGISVMSDDNTREVHPSQVMGPSVAGPIVFIVDCPTLSHLQHLISLNSLCDYYDGVKIVNCVIHLSPSPVARTAEYQTWMSRFGRAQHIMAGHEKKNMEIPILRSSAKMAAWLNYLCPNLFPSCGLRADNQNLGNAESDNTALNVVAVSNSAQSVAAENLLKFKLRPYSQLGLDTSAIPKWLGDADVIDELLKETPKIVDAAAEVSHLWNKTESDLPSCLENITRDDMEIVFLGTGSSQPSIYRNVSSIFINLFSKGSLFLDCGEGTLGQLRKRFGVIGANDAVRGLKCIWISHMHADHFSGITSILSLRCRLLKGTNRGSIIVIAPAQLKKYLDRWVEDLDFQFLDCGHTTYDEWKGFESNCERPGESTALFGIQQNLKQVLGEAGLEALISVPVIHCRDAFGLVLKAVERLNTEGKTIPGWKLVYSGDTRPCQNLKNESAGATVLIHEATFDDKHKNDAIAKNHSTITEAIEVGDGPDGEVGNGAYRIILTHFSQRYPKMADFSDTLMHKTCIAFDLMSVNMADLPVLPKVLPHLTLLFKNENENENENETSVR